MYGSSAEPTHKHLKNALVRDNSPKHCLPVSKLTPQTSDATKLGFKVVKTVVVNDVETKIESDMFEATKARLRNAKALLRRAGRKTAD